MLMLYKNQIIHFLFFSLLFFPVWGVVAQDTTTHQLDPVVITGTRIEQQKSKVPASITIINRETIEQSGASNILPVLAAQVPGFFLNARNPVGYGVGPNSGGNISIRGVSGTPNTQVLVLIDGQPQFMGIFGHPIADAYTASDVERVEVLRGAASLLYGSNAMGGAINIITRSPQEDGLHGNAKVAYGSFNTGVYNASLGYKKGKFNTFASFNHEQTDGFREDGNDDFSNTTGYWKGSYQFSEKLTLAVDANIADASYYFPGTTAEPLENEKRDYLRGRTAIALENEFGKVEGALKLFYNFGQHEFSDGFDSNDFNRGLTFYQNLKLIPNNIITLGIDYKNYGGTAENNNLPPPAQVGLGTQHAINETETYAIVQHTFFEKLSVNGGIRLVDNSQFGFTAVPGVGATYQVHDNTTLKASASKAYRSPTVNDLYLFPPSNDALQPENMWNYEVGIAQSAFKNKLHIEATGFIMEGENLILEVPTGMPGPPQRRNTGSFSNKGIELQTKYFATNNLDFLLNYSLLDASEAVLFAPKQNLNFQARYAFKKLSLQAGLQHISGLRTAPVTDSELEKYTLVQAQLRFEATKWMHLFINGDNLLDVSYEVQEGFPMPGISFLGGVNFHF